AFGEARSSGTIGIHSAGGRYVQYARMNQAAILPNIRAGELLAGKYRVDRVVGAGGMGVVVAATHMQLDQRVALKFVLPESLGNVETVERFKREAKAAVKLR